MKKKKVRDVVKSRNSQHTPVCKLRNDEALHRLRKIKSNTFHAMVTDPPCGLGLDFKSKTRWDSDKGGKQSWIAWLAEILAETHRVLRPGAHVLLWSIPKTQHWSAEALERAGFEIVDVVVNIFGRSLIKGQDASVAIDKKLGLERKVVGLNKNYRKANTHGTNFVYNAKTHDTVSTDPRSLAWEGYRTNLKPGQECWILARKKHEGTVAENIIKYGCGAVFIGKKNIDRIQSNALLQHHRECTKSLCVTKCPVRKLRRLNPNAPNFFTSFYYADKISRKERQDDKNTHPTVKPFSLMKFLVNLVTPLHGTVIDPFMGSGSTGVAALKLGRGFYGIERETEFFEIAKRRTSKLQGNP